MDNIQDPRIQIPTNLDEVQKEIEQAVDDRKKEIKQEMKDQRDSLKEEVKDLKQEAKDQYKDYKDYKKDSDDPVAKEKVAIKKEVSSVVTKNIEQDYSETMDRLDREEEERIASLDRMLDNSLNEKKDMQDINRLNEFPII